MPTSDVTSNPESMTASEPAPMWPASSREAWSALVVLPKNGGRGFRAEGVHFEAFPLRMVITDPH